MVNGLIALEDDPRGRIFLVQIARAVEYADRTDQKHLLNLLREFVRECEDRIRRDEIERDILLKFCPDKTFYRSIVLERQEHYLHQDSSSLITIDADSNVQLATVVTLKALREYMLKPKYGNKLLENPNEAQDTLADPDDDLWQEDARVGVKFDPESNHFWATKFEALEKVAPSLKRHPDTVVLPKNDAGRIRDFLGLGHFGEGETLALMVFDENTMHEEFEAHRNSNSRAEFRFSRPFLFEGVGNHRFYIFEPRESKEWNNALELSAIQTEQDPCGGPEVVLSSIPCKYVRRIHLLSDLSPSPCFDAEPEIENIMIQQMLEDGNFESAVDKVRALLSEPA
ncbi:hypothetical protein [uncultured Roseobacter sp.]|uniref:hypothetical protein n=1 Tax=uncultured Roseobacter sp. TaxID=114847 RepID=UPI00261D52E2|nr:hypothetical protein [uncultured Roseobacter sp.]